MADGSALGSVAGGALSGAATGSTLGPYGAAAGAVIGGVMGGIKQSKAGDAQNINAVDPMERSRLEELRRMSRQLQTGTDPLTQLNIKESQAAGRAGMRAVGRVTGGDVGTTVSAMQRVQKGAQGAQNRAIAEAAKRIPYFDNARGALTSKIADRKLQLQLLNRSQRTAESAQYQTDQNVSNQALMGAIGGGLGSSLQAAAPTGDAAVNQTIPVSSEVLGGRQFQPVNPQVNQFQPTILNPGLQQQSSLFVNPSVGQLQPALGQSIF